MKLTIEHYVEINFLSNNNVGASSTRTKFSKVSQTIQVCKTVNSKFLEKEAKLVTVSCEQFVSAPIFDETVISATLLRRLHFSIRNFFSPVFRSA